MGTAKNVLECSLGFWVIFKRILEMISFKILGNVEEDSRECSRRFRGMLVNILCIAQEDSGECSILDSWEYSRRLDAL